MKFNIVGIFESHSFLSLTQFLIMLDSAERKCANKTKKLFNFLALEIICVYMYYIKVRITISLPKNVHFRIVSDCSDLG